MSQSHHYTGLTDAEVSASRLNNGINILTPRHLHSHTACHRARIFLRTESRQGIRPAQSDQR